MARGQCPKCRSELVHGEQGGVPSRSCDSCGGRWVDVLQLESLTEKSPVADELVRVYAELSTQALEGAGLDCPGCGSDLLLGAYSRIAVDTCRSCKGMFLDRHELEGVVDHTTTRPCPKCNSPMRADEVAGVPTNSCRGCGGRWLEVPMIEHLSELSSEARQTRDALIRSFVSLHDGDTRGTDIPCPTCQAKLEACDHGGVELDFCFRCRGLFVDPGEMEQIAAGEPSPAERTVTAVAGKALGNLVGALSGLLKH